MVGLGLAAAFPFTQRPGSNNPHFVSLAGLEFIFSIERGTPWPHAFLEGSPHDPNCFFLLSAASDVFTKSFVVPIFLFFCEIDFFTLHDESEMSEQLIQLRAKRF